MDGDLGAAAAPLDNDKATARPRDEETKSEDPAALGEKQEEATTTMPMEEAKEPAAPEASAAPAPPSRSGGPFSSTVIPRTVDTIVDDHFKRRDAILRAITDGEKRRRDEEEESKGVIVDFFEALSLCLCLSRRPHEGCIALLSTRCDQRELPISSKMMKSALKGRGAE